MYFFKSLVGIFEFSPPTQATLIVIRPYQFPISKNCQKTSGLLIALKSEKSHCIFSKISREYLMTHTPRSGDTDCNPLFSKLHFCTYHSSRGKTAKVVVPRYLGREQGEAWPVKRSEAISRQAAARTSTLGLTTCTIRAGKESPCLHRDRAPVPAPPPPSVGAPTLFVSFESTNSPSAPARV